MARGRHLGRIKKGKVLKNGSKYMVNFFGDDNSPNIELIFQFLSNLPAGGLQEHWRFEDHVPWRVVECSEDKGWLQSSSWPCIRDFQSNETWKTGNQLQRGHNHKCCRPSNVGLHKEERRTIHSTTTQRIRATPRWLPFHHAELLILIFCCCYF